MNVLMHEKFGIRLGVKLCSNILICTDILLLADIFEEFCKISLKTYGISPTDAYTLSYQMFKADEEKFELLTDLEIIMFLETGFQGGLSQCDTGKQIISICPQRIHRKKIFMHFNINNNQYR